MVTFAALIVVILTFVAFAIDLGFGRSDRRTSRSLTDLAAVAAGYQMAGNADANPFNPQADPVAACRAAIESVRTNSEDFDPPLNASEDCDRFSTCDPMQGPVEVSDGPWQLTIHYPVSDLSIRDPNLGSDGLSSEDGQPCERMRVTLDHVRETLFAGVVGVSELRTGGSAVVVGKIPDPVNRVVPAFLMLDRTACKAIWTNVGQGTVAPDPSLLYGDGILVRTGMDGQPGFIHTDSDATACGNAANDYAIYANEPSGGTDTMVVQSGVDEEGNSALGVIESTATNGRSGAGGTNVPVSVGQVVGRLPVDEIFQGAISSLYGVAHAAVTASVAPTATVGEPVVTYGCNGTPSSAPPATGPWTAYINCVGPPANTAFSNSLVISATTVVFAGNVSVGNGVLISLPEATEVVVRKELAVPQGKLDLPRVRNLYVGERFTIGGTAAVGINAFFSPLDPPTATNPRCGAGGRGSDTASTTRVVVFNPVNSTSPALESAGRLTMCQTTVYLAGEKHDSAYSEQSIQTGSSCSDEFPCPLVAGNEIPGARFALSGTVNWFGPNQSNTPLSSNVVLPSQGGIEDLAAWAEGGGATNATEASTVSGGGTTFTYSGIFFTPNSKIELAAGNANTGPVDAQFIARLLQLNGGRFEMRPSKQNAVPVPVRGSFQLIR